MKGINLGLEALSASGISGRVDNAYISSYIQFNEAAFEVMDTCYQLDQLLTTYGTVKAIGNCIRKHGVTQSLESLYGENYRSAASMEEENTAAKETLWQKIRRIIEELLRKIKNFFIWLMDSGERAKRRLSKITGKTGAFSWSGGQINSTEAFAKKAEALLREYDDGKRAITTVEGKLKAEKAKKEPSETEIGSLKDQLTAAIKKNKENIKAMNDLAEAAEKAIKKGGKDEPNKMLTSSSSNDEKGAGSNNSSTTSNDTAADESNYDSDDGTRDRLFRW